MFIRQLSLGQSLLILENVLTLEVAWAAREALLITVGPSEVQCFLRKEFLRLVAGLSLGFFFGSYDGLK